jgi:hypothetical protein
MLLGMQRDRELFLVNRGFEKMESTRFHLYESSGDVTVQKTNIYWMSDARIYGDESVVCHRQCFPAARV